MIYWRAYFQTLLLSSMHHSVERDGESQNPAMITCYNDTKVSVDCRATESNSCMVFLQQKK